MAITDDVVGISDLEARLGRKLSGADVARAQENIDDTYALVTGRALLSDPVTEPQKVVVARVALRAFNNPNGYRSQTSGPFSVTYSSDSNPGVYLTPSDVAEMRGGRRGSARSMSMSTPYDYIPEEPV